MIILIVVIIVSLVLSAVQKHPFWSGNVLIDMLIYAAMLFAVYQMHKSKKENQEIEELIETEKRAKALFEEACMYESGEGVKKDLSMARERFAEAAELGYADAQSALGFYYQHGNGGLEKDEVKAFELYQLAGAHLRLGLCYRDGIGTVKDDKKAASEFLHASASGDDEGHYLYGKCLEYGTGTKQNLKRAFESYKDGADAGNLDSKLALASCYEEGKGVEPDLGKAMQLYTTVWIRKPSLAAKCQKAIARVKAEKVRQYFENGAKAVQEGGDASALYREGYALIEEGTAGDGIAKMEKAAFLGDFRAQYAMGGIYAAGAGVEKDEDIAFAWYQKGIAGGNVMELLEGYPFVRERDAKLAEEMLQIGYRNNYPGAYCIMGDKFLEETTPRAEEAFSCYQKAAGLSDHHAMVKVADCYHRGIGTEKDEVKAAEWYKKAAQTGSPQASYAYGTWMLETKERPLTQENMQEIISLIFNAAEQNHPDACYIMGYLLQMGKDEDFVEYYKTAGKQGHKGAICELIRHYVEIKDEEQILYWVECLAEKGNESAQIYAAKTNMDNNNLERSVYWWEKLMERKNPYAKEYLERLDVLLYLQGEIEKNRVLMEKNEQRYNEWEAQQSVRQREFENWSAENEKSLKRQRLNNAELIGQIFGAGDAADYLAKHFKDEINANPFLWL